MLQCSSCENRVIFEIILNVECDWGKHTIIQCPKCEDLYTIDGPCQAFSNLIRLVEFNKTLLTDDESREYSESIHPCDF